jgi:hypothetical protein
MVRTFVSEDCRSHCPKCRRILQHHRTVRRSNVANVAFPARLVLVLYSQNEWRLD